jgi:diaminohydroxyphosphoribosylaminopyrimidine deaminase / 5-amino-6-(5-phosphoribosylamino)uracil reductase
VKSEELMIRAINLAKKGAGQVSPNPLVGALIIKNGEVISEGWHKKFGSAHAEVEAVINAGNVDFAGATMVVNLEPCSHFGKTPPCAPMLIEKGFSKVVIGMQDPNPLVSGKGIELLTNAGIEVEVNVLETACNWLNRYFVKQITQNIPYVIAKTGISIDGQIATYSGNSKWITGEESRRRVHQLRSEVDAVLVGEITAQKDNPKLNVRNIVGRNPKRVLLDSNLSTPLELELFKDEDRKNTIVFCSDKASHTRKADNLRLAGVSIVSTEIEENDFIHIESVLSTLTEKFSINSLLVEGGSKTYSSFLKKNLIDELKIFYAPIAIGNGLRVFDGISSYYVKDAPKFKFIDLGWSGEDIEITAVKVEQ